MTDKELFYDSIADDFDTIMNHYDLNRRIEVIFEVFLENHDLSNKKILDGGCGTGEFSVAASRRGAKVTSLDISPNLVKIAQEKSSSTGVVGSLLELPFEKNSFDYVISSDVIEHTPEPYKATQELIRVLKPGGTLCLTVPNKTFWYFSLVLANALKIRKYQGFENWVHFREFRRFLEKEPLNIVSYRGIHSFPFVVPPLNSFLRICDDLAPNWLHSTMVNIAVCAKKI